MMAILRGLRDELRKHNLKLSDILPVAGIDPGTLEDRYTDAFTRGSVVAKTGTLIRTDGGASSLVGQMNTKSGRVVSVRHLQSARQRDSFSRQPGRDR